MGKLDRGTDSYAASEGRISLYSKEVFCENIRLCEKSMYNLAFSILKNEDDAGDAVSEAIYRAYRSFDKLKDINVFKSWILKIVHNTSVEMIRKNSRLKLTGEIEETEDSSYELNIATRITVREAVTGLKQPYQTIVILFYYENLSVNEISNIMESSTVAVKKQLERARKMLLEALKEEFDR